MKCTTIAVKTAATPRESNAMSSVVISRLATLCLELTCSSGRHPGAGSDGGNCVRCSRSGDRDKCIRLPSSRPKFDSSNIAMIACLIVLCLLPAVSTAYPTEPSATSSSWEPTGSQSISKQTSNILRNSTITTFLLFRRGDNDSPPSTGDNSSLVAATLPNQGVVSGDGFKNVSKEEGSKSDISGPSRPLDQDTVNRIVSIVAPFTCVILVAGSLTATYKLCHRYRCYRNEAGLRKCLTFCDRCLSTPYVFQLADSKKDLSSTSPVSSDSGRSFRYSFNSVSSSSSRTSATPSSPLVKNTHRNAGPMPTTQHTPIRQSSTSSSHSGASRDVSRSSKSSVGSNTSSRQNSTLTLVSTAASIGSGIVYQNPRQVDNKQHTSGHLQPPGFHLSRPSNTAGSRASVHSRGSIQSRAQAHRVPGAISRRQNSIR